MNVTTQCDRILTYVEDFGSITPIEALEDLGVMRLAARISDLEHRGVHFDREMVQGQNRYGETVRYARYKRAV